MTPETEDLVALILFELMAIFIIVFPPWQTFVGLPEKGTPEQEKGHEVVMLVTVILLPLSQFVNWWFFGGRVFNHFAPLAVMAGLSLVLPLLLFLSKASIEMVNAFRSRMLRNISLITLLWAASVSIDWKPFLS